MDPEESAQRSGPPRTPPEALDRFEGFVRGLNPDAKIYRTVRGQIDTDLVLECISTEIVFIGRGMPVAAIVARLDACIADGGAAG